MSIASGVLCRYNFRFVSSRKFILKVGDFIKNVVIKYYSEHHSRMGHNSMGYCASRHLSN